MNFCLAHLAGVTLLNKNHTGCMTLNTLFFYDTINEFSAKRAPKKSKKEPRAESKIPSELFEVDLQMSDRSNLNETKNTKQKRK